MTIASEITKLNTNLTNAYNAVSDKGGTLPTSQNFDNLATTINSLPSATKYSVSPDNMLGDPDSNGILQKPTSNFIFSLSNTVTDISNYALFYRFYAQDNITSVNLSSLTTLTGNYALSHAFQSCKNLTSVNLSSLTSITGTFGFEYTFGQCYKLTSFNLPELTKLGARALDHTFVDGGLSSVSFPKLTTVNNSCNYTFQGCRNLTSVNLPVLTTIGTTGLYYTFASCSKLASISFPAVSSVDGNYALAGLFQGCTSLADIYFNSLKTTSFGSTYKNQFTSMLQNTGTTVTHTIHFPSNLESTISGLSGYPLFGGTSGYVVLAFDLPATS